VAWEQLARRLRGETAMFDPFAAGIRSGSRSGAAAIRPPAKRSQIAVATGGNLYPCSPMVGEDRDTGRECAVRLGSLSDGADAILSRVRADGVGCSDGKNCACAAYLETGDRTMAGPNGLWMGQVCRELGQAIARGLTDQTRGGIGRRPFLLGFGAVTLAAGAAVPAMLRAGVFGGDDDGCDWRERTLGKFEQPPEPTPQPPGQLVEPPPAEPAPLVEEARPDGDVSAPSAPGEIHIRGDIAEPSEIVSAGDLG
jgi:hypothetical protein